MDIHDSVVNTVKYEFTEERVIMAFWAFSASCHTHIYK